ncbi:MAG: hypothetical protein A4S16_08580 [Proteobacteria bacterium SG_bin6]|nr:MAG: hypothetical protein A4S16_08580 [Proteobacteria bacterium SG_bin6]
MPWIVAVVGANVALALGPWFIQLAETGPLASAFWRVAIASPLLLPALLLLPREQRLPRGAIAPLLIAGQVFAASLAIYCAGIVRTTVTNAVLLGNCAVLFFPLYAMLAERVRPGRAQIAALVLACLGAALLLGRSVQLDAARSLGDLLCLVAGIVYTAFFVVTARLAGRVAPLPAFVWMTVASAPPLFVFTVLSGEALIARDWGPLIASAAVAQVIGQGLLVLTVGRLSPVAVGAGLLIQPVVGAVIDVVANGYRPDLADAAGAVLVAVAVLMATLAPTRR